MRVGSRHCALPPGWGGGDNRCLRVYLGHFESVTCCAVYARPGTGASGAGGDDSGARPYALALSGSLDETLKVWHLDWADASPGPGAGPEAAGERCCRHTLTGHEAGVTSCVAYGSGSVALSGSFDRTLKVWDVPDR